MTEQLNEWVEEHVEELKLVKEHGRTETLRAQAKAFLEVSDIDIEEET